MLIGLQFQVTLHQNQKFREGLFFSCIKYIHIALQKRIWVF